LSNSSTVPTLLLAWLIAALLPACAAARHEPDAREYHEFLVSEMSYDDNGLPKPAAVLSERPSRPGDHYTIVSYTGQRLMTSCDVAVRTTGPDLRKPLRAVYEWTGKGFEVGLQATMVLTHGLHGTMSGPDALAALAFVITPIAIGGVTGFVIGIGDGMVQTAVELHKIVLDSSEQVLTCTLYDYDLRGRLHRMRMLTPDRKEELVRTTFEYSGPGREPARTVVESFVEGKQRNIR
jgi:hypothetical protein